MVVQVEEREMLLISNTTSLTLYLVKTGKYDLEMKIDVIIFIIKVLLFHVKNHKNQIK